MKTLGRNDSGSWIVLLSNKEYNAIKEMQTAIEGYELTMFGPEPNRNIPEQELDDAFKAIYLWARTKFRINALKNMVNDFDAILTQENK